MDETDILHAQATGKTVATTVIPSVGTSADSVTGTLAVIIVSYNTRELLRRCLLSIERATPPTGMRVEILVVDNASHDGSAQMVATEFPNVQLLAAPVNLGFTGGNNLALYALGLRVQPPRGGRDLVAAPRTIPPRYLFLLNPDTELAADTLVEFTRAMQTTPLAAICGARLHYADGTFQHAAFRFPGLGQVALDLFPLVGVPGAHRLRDSRFNGRYPQSDWQGHAPFPVDFVLGAAMFVRTTALYEVGGLDEDYFMYCEEMDWCLRLHAAGWGVYAVPTAHVLHLEGQSSRQQRWDAFERLWQSRFRFYIKHAARYPVAFRLALRALVRLGAAWQAAQIRRRFAAGEVDGQSAARALQAYATLRRL
jgi:GT2 family glycosyltransferase